MFMVFDDLGGKKGKVGLFHALAVVCPQLERYFSRFSQLVNMITERLSPSPGRYAPATDTALNTVLYIVKSAAYYKLV